MKAKVKESTKFCGPTERDCQLVKVGTITRDSSLTGGEVLCQDCNHGRSKGDSPCKTCVNRSNYSGPVRASTGQNSHDVYMCTKCGRKVVQQKGR